MKNRPTNIQVDRQAKTLTIKWNDGHNSEYSFTVLRHACPCAECRGGHENMKPEPDPEVFSIAPEDSLRTKLVNVEGVGSYAITLHWEDGHQYGIYNWDFLRALCPCSECRQE